MAVTPISTGIRRSGWLQPHRVGLIVLGALILLAAIWLGRWDWLPRYLPRLGQGLIVTLAMLFGSAILGFLIALPLGLAQAAGPWWLNAPAKLFCTVIRGTPLLLQLWLIYYGLGSLFPSIPGIRDSVIWPYLREAWPYGLAALTFSFAAYEGEVMRGAFAGVPQGELEAGRAFGMSRWKVFRRIWLPRAIHRALPTLGGETVLQLKATPLVATVTVVDLYGVISRVRQETFLTYEPLLLLALVYLILAGLLAWLFQRLENSIPRRG